MSANYSPIKSLVPPTRFQSPNPAPNPNQYSERNKRFRGRITFPATVLYIFYYLCVLLTFWIIYTVYCIVESVIAIQLWWKKILCRRMFLLKTFLRKQNLKRMFFSWRRIFRLNCIQKVWLIVWFVNWNCTSIHLLYLYESS